MCAVSLLSIGKLHGGFKPLVQKLVTEEKGCAHEIKVKLKIGLLLHCTLKTLMIFTAVKSILNFPAPFWTEDGFLENFGRENSKLKFPFKFCSLHHELLQTDLIFSFRRIWQWRSSIQFPLWFCQWLWKWPKATKPSTTSFWFASSYVVILLALSFPSD